MFHDYETVRLNFNRTNLLILLVSDYIEQETTSVVGSYDPLEVERRPTAQWRAHKSLKCLAICLDFAYTS